MTGIQKTALFGLIGIGAAALFLREKRGAGTAKPLGQSKVFSAIASHPITFGIGSGLVGGSVAAIRNKPVTLFANAVTALVVGISEGALVPDPKKAVETALLTMLGVTAGMAPFTRIDPEQRALVERAAAI
jgi:hypothetical protein